MLLFVNLVTHEHGVVVDQISLMLQDFLYFFDGERSLEALHTIQQADLIARLG